MSDPRADTVFGTCGGESVSGSRAGCPAKRLRYRLGRTAYLKSPGESGAVSGAAAPRSAEAVELKKQVERLNDRYLRARSDLENYRKRAAREREEHIRYANESLIKSLLDTVDNLERAIHGAEKTKDVEALHSGVELVHQQFIASLKRCGVEVIAAEPHAKFDPLCHEAVMATSEPGFENDTIVECLQPGYTLNSRVLRAAMVKVAKN